MSTSTGSFFKGYKKRIFGKDKTGLCYLTNWIYFVSYYYGYDYDTPLNEYLYGDNLPQELVFTGWKTDEYTLFEYDWLSHNVHGISDTATQVLNYVILDGKFEVPVIQWDHSVSNISITM